MGAVRLVIIYLLVGWVHRKNVFAPPRSKSHTLIAVSDLDPGGIGRYLLTAGISFGGVWIAVLISNGDPIWPGLALVAAVLGRNIFPGYNETRKWRCKGR